jgi:Tol biopolymer transport system component
VQQFSEDLRTAVVWAYDLPGVTGDAPLRNNIYTEDTVTRALTPVTVSQVAQPTIFDFLDNAMWGFSADARHIAFVAGTQFLPDAADAVPNVYQWDNGVLSLAGVLPDGTVPSGGSDILSSPYRRAMSTDGTRLVFSASSGGNPQLYTRIGGTRTVWISETEVDPSDPNYQPDPSNVRLEAVTPDGRNVFFTTDTPLVPGDANSTTDLYRYRESASPSSDRNLTMISQDGGMGNGEVVGTSDDGGRIYFRTAGNHLILWNHGAIHLITDQAVISGDPVANSFGLFGWKPGGARATPDGNYIAFATSSTSDQDMLGNVTNAHREFYLYSLADDSLACVSCPPGAATSDATVAPAVTSGQPELFDFGVRPRFLSDRGHVFFSTADALVPQDKNGVLDAYEYDPSTGATSLLSTGKGSDPASFADASASGDDVFLVTRQRLAATDRDSLVDVYDVRDGSSLPDLSGPPQVACEGDTCQPPPSTAPPERSVGSSTFDDSSGGGVHVTVGVRQRVVLHGLAGSLSVRLSAAGRLTWKGKGLSAGSIERAKPGAQEVRLRLGKRARVHLKHAGVYRTTVHFTFVSDGGHKSTRTARVTFRAAAKKGR